jgi:Permuted papain-like amidase enzyme, YaeF/YiiX, C92 family
MSWILDSVGGMLAQYLDRADSNYEPASPSDPDALRAALLPGDVLLVEGTNKISGMIKYLTQSTWSHAALFTGPIGDRTTADGEALTCVEANIGEGVIATPLSKYFKYHTRICRPVGLSAQDRRRVCNFAAERIGFDYDLKNIIDLARYFVPLPVPRRFRRRMLAIGSGQPTQMICSSLIAESFASVRYPILPKITRLESKDARREILEIRHSSLYAPRDFDISPYFDVIKPSIVQGFDYKAMEWVDPLSETTLEPIAAGAIAPKEAA